MAGLSARKSVVVSLRVPPNGITGSSESGIRVPMPQIDPEIRAYRRGRFVLGLTWLACLVLGPYWVFEFGNYHGQVKAYREEHSQELYAQEQKDRAPGAEAYAIDTGQPSLRRPLELSKLESSQEIYSFLAFVWIFVTAGLWRVRQQHKKECPQAYAS